MIILWMSTEGKETGATSADDFKTENFNGGVDVGVLQALLQHVPEITLR